MKEIKLLYPTYYGVKDGVYLTCLYCYSAPLEKITPYSWDGIAKCRHCFRTHDRWKGVWIRKYMIYPNDEWFNPYHFREYYKNEWWTEVMKRSNSHLYLSVPPSEIEDVNSKCKLPVRIYNNWREDVYLKRLDYKYRF